MASIPTADLDAALASAEMVSTTAYEVRTDPPGINVSSGVEGAGLFVSVRFAESDVIDINGQMLARGFVPGPAIRNAEQGSTSIVWVPAPSAPSAPSVTVSVGG